MHPLICAKLQKGFLRCWWIAIVFGVVLIISSTVLAIVFPFIAKILVNQGLVLKEGSKSFESWKDPPVTPQMHVYIYNVTNAHGFLNNGEKPALRELGPYVYFEKWEKVNIEFNENATVTYNIKKTFTFSEDLSSGSDEDFVIVPNVTMLSVTSKLKGAESWTRRALAEDLTSEPFIRVSVNQLLWGYEEPLLDLISLFAADPDTVPDKIGMLYGKNGTAKDNYTIFTGASDITKYGLLNKFNGNDGLGLWPTPDCDSVLGTDGGIFPPHITKQTVLKVFQKDLCQLMPLVYERDIITAGGVLGYRFAPPTKSLSSPNRDPTQQCLSPHAPKGMFNVSLCQNDSPLLLSFPHFYQADPSLRHAVTGISPPEAEKHQTYVDVQPTMGITVRARARMQINLAVSHVPDIESVASFPDIVFPIMWFEDRIDELSENATLFIKEAVEYPIIAQIFVSFTLAALGLFILIGALICLACISNRQDKLHSSNPLPVNKVLTLDLGNPFAVTNIV